MTPYNTPPPEDIAPFMWVDHDNGTCSLILYVGDYLVDVFETRADAGFEGSGYDWNSLALVFLEEKMPEVAEVINADPEGSMFCMYSNDAAALEKFARGFRAACEDRKLITDLFSRAELD